MAQSGETSRSGEKRTATLSYPGGEHEMEIVEATEGASGVSLGKLLGETGLVTLDPGFVNTGSCRSDITYIDGDAGILRYRGYPIEQLAQHSTFVETSYLLIYDELPSESQLAEFTDQIQRHTMLHEDLKKFFDGFPVDAHPMPVLSSATRSTSPTSTSRASACWPRCPRSRPTPTRTRSASRSSTRTTRWAWWRTSCA